MSTSVMTERIAESEWLLSGFIPTNALLVRRSATGSRFSPRHRRPLPMAKSKRKRVPKTVLKLPDLEQSKSAVLNSLTSASSKRSYDHAIREFIAWYYSEPRLAFNRTVVTRHRMALEQHPYAPSTINLRLAAIRRLAYEASDCGLLSPDLAAGIRRVTGFRRLGVRVGNWLTAEEGKKLLTAENADTLRSRRNRALLSLLIGCGLRRAEVTTLRLEDLQLREPLSLAKTLGVLSFTPLTMLQACAQAVDFKVGHHFGEGHMWRSP